jgi:hypothetical protein
VADGTRGVAEYWITSNAGRFRSLTPQFTIGFASSRTTRRASAEKIRALCPQEISLKAIQRSLAKLEARGWLKRFRVRGRRGNYPILIGRYYVRDLSLKWLSVNIDRTIDWRAVQFDAVTDESFIVANPVTESGSEVGTEPGSEVSPIQEVEVRRQNGDFRKHIDRSDDAVRAKKSHCKPKQTYEERVEAFAQTALKNFANRHPEIPTDQVSYEIREIFNRADESGVTIGSAEYFMTALQNAFQPDQEPA